MAAATTQRFRDSQIVFDNGAAGENVEIPSASPLNYFQALNDPGAMPRTTIDGKLFLPPATSAVTTATQTAPCACVIIVPGSLGVAPSHLAHAQSLTDLGIAALVIDPFGSRSVTSTVANQAQYSFAASAWDVLAAAAALARDGRIDGQRIGAQGHSRGGAAVMTAATRRFADAGPEDTPSLRAVLAAYPWCGHQFLDPTVGTTRVRVLIGDRDGWCLPQQVQGHVQAIRLTGGDVSLRLFADAVHSFDRGTAIVNVPDASVAPSAPTGYLADSGAFIHPLTGVADPALVDRDVMLYGIKAGYGVRGAVIGSNPGDAEAFRDDMVRFWREAMRV